MQQPEIPQQTHLFHANNPHVTPEMLQWKQALGIPTFSTEMLAGNPQMIQAYQQSDMNGKCMLEAQWLNFQIQHYYKEKEEGRYYPALGNKEEWEKRQQGGGGQVSPKEDMQESEQNDFDEGGI